MAIHFTQQQEKVLQARNHNILVSAAAGSGKTAVLVERIVRMISEGDHPMDIDRLLVVTFTRAAAAQMRERIASAISKRLQEDPDNIHLQRQATLLHNAQITTMDSFFTFLLRNNFSEIDLDPGYRQMDQTESDLLKKDALEDFLEECYAAQEPEFLECVEYFCPGKDDSGLVSVLDSLYRQAVSHPDPAQWLMESAEQYCAGTASELYSTQWMHFLVRQVLIRIEDIVRSYDYMLSLCEEAGGPEVYLPVLRQERELFSSLGAHSFPRTEKSSDPESLQLSWEEIQNLWNLQFQKLPACTVKKYPDLDVSKKEAVTSLRDQIKKSIGLLKKRFSGQTTEIILGEMREMARPVRTVCSLTIRFLQYFGAVKREKNAIDFVDLEHYALQILAKREEDGTYTPRGAAVAYRQYFDEILIDEYQDSNEVQELLLRMISGEDEGHYNRFMVGDVKQSIYKFRLARPEIFMAKFGKYREKDSERELISLDRNFRSRREVLDSVNTIFRRIMRREIGGIEYTAQEELKVGADYYPDVHDMPWDALHAYEVPDSHRDDPYRTELLVLDSAADKNPKDESSTETAPDDEIASMSGRRQEALAIAQKIHALVGNLPVNGEDGTQRPCRYGDIVVLLRSGAGWNEDFRDVFEKQGIPAYIDTKTGYFSAQEIRTVLQVLRILVNPRQDIPLYGAMRSYFGGFDEEKFALLRAECPDSEMDLYSAVEERARRETADPLTVRCRKFLQFLEEWRDRAQYMQVHTLLSALLSETGYEDWCSALPGGEQRAANLHMLLAQAGAFDAMSLTGLFSFVRYIDQMHRREVDYGEANTLDANADVVRIMTIHKSKGLEFPICIVAGLSKNYSYLRHDTSGSFLCDNDWGIGTKYWDAQSRTWYRTARQEAIAEKIRRDSLGEELRVLYVAMTRAQEKLILTGHLGNSPKKWDTWAQSGNRETGEKLSLSSLADSTCFLGLIRIAMQGIPCADSLFAVSRIHCSDLSVEDVLEQAGQAQRKERLMLVEDGSGRELPDPELARKLHNKFSRRYAHENLRGLYTKTSVSELKLASMEELLEEADTLFPDNERAPVRPSFAAEEEESAVSRERQGMTGAEYGTAVHRMLQLFDYARFRDPSAVTRQQMQAWKEELAAAGRIPPQYLGDMGVSSLLAFLHSNLAQRMARAAARGQLFREQPFVLGIPADTLCREFPHAETVLIQGILDAFFVEDGQIVIVDYKTDRVQRAAELTDRYHVQLEYYAQALRQITGIPVREKLIYSTRLRETIPV